MNSLDTIIIVCFNFINIALLWLAWHFLWRQACQERLRQKLFELRDELFDLALTGKIAFDDQAYVLLRLRINSMIRFSNRLGLTRVFTFVCLQRYIGLAEKRAASAVLNSEISQVSGRETKEQLTRISSSIDHHITKHLLCISPQIVIASPVLFLLNAMLSGKHDEARSHKIDPKNVGLRIIEAQAREAYILEKFDRKVRLRTPVSVGVAV